MLTDALLGGESLDMGAVHLALDQFKVAALLTREVDTEGEAVALSRLGSGERRAAAA